MIFGKLPQQWNKTQERAYYTVIFLAFLFAGYTGSWYINRVPPIKIEEVKKENTSTIASNNHQKYISVSIHGGVGKPGKYKLPVNSTVQDIIDVAGGLKNNYTLSSINPDKILQNNDKIFIHHRIERETATITKTKKKSSLVHQAKKNIQDIRTVHINRADSAQWMKLPGIGRKTAEKIIQYREKNGNFKSKEELMIIPGISLKKYNKIKEYLVGP